MNSGGPNSSRRFQILSLSGGGFRGLYSAAVLTELERSASKPLAQCFDLIAGTSIGGIIALALALEVPAEKILHAFATFGHRIFSHRPAPRYPLGKAVDLSRSLFKPKYDGKGLRDAISEIVGPETRMESLIHPVIVPTINMTTGSPQFFKTPHHKNFTNDWRERVVDVALATSAAPTFFPLAKIGNSFYVDGGLYANSPDLMALHEAVHFLGASEADVYMVSLGTTTASFSFSHRIGRNLGALRWMYGQRLLSAIFSAQQQCGDSMLKHRLRERYFRIDEMQSREQQEDLGLDVATQEVQEMLIGLGVESAKRSLGCPQIADILRSTALEPIFYHGVSKNSEHDS